MYSVMAPPGGAVDFGGIPLGRLRRATHDFDLRADQHACFVRVVDGFGGGDFYDRGKRIDGFVGGAAFVGARFAGSGGEVTAALATPAVWAEHGRAICLTARSEHARQSRKPNRRQ